MSGWIDIATAPKDGSVVRVRRNVNGEVLFEGLASWRTVVFAELPPHPIDADIYAQEETATGWMRHDQDKRFPYPTEWLPQD